MTIFFKETPHYPFMRWSKWFLRLSLVLVVVSIALFVFRGPNYGIDFRGGTELMIETNATNSVADIRSAIQGMIDGDVVVRTQSGGSDGQVNMLIRIASDGAEAAMSEDEISKIRTDLAAQFSGTEVRGVNSIGGVVSGEIVSKGITAIILTLFAIGIYIWLRFEWTFSMGAIIALFHDVSLTLGLFVVTQMTFDLSIVAALLAIIGYSLNDTVVVYDRIREKLGMHPDEPIDTVINRGVNETLRRTLMTSITTLIAILAIMIFGGPVLRGFSIAMFWGVLVGTYSSIFIASPILTKIGIDREDKPKAKHKFADIDA